MKNKFIQLTMIATMLTACNAPTNKEVADDFKYADEQFADLQMLRYMVQGFEDLTLKQIAEITDTNLSTVKTRLYTALDRLKTTLKEA